MLLESYYSKRYYLMIGRIPLSVSKVLEQHSDTLYSNEYLSRKPPILLATLVKKLINFRPSKHVQSKVRNTWNESTGSASYHYACLWLYFCQQLQKSSLSFPMPQFSNDILPSSCQGKVYWIFLNSLSLLIRDKVDLSVAFTTLNAPTFLCLSHTHMCIHGLKTNR